MALLSLSLSTFHSRCGETTDSCVAQGCGERDGDQGGGAETGGERERESIFSFSALQPCLSAFIDLIITASSIKLCSGNFFNFFFFTCKQCLLAVNIKRTNTSLALYLWLCHSLLLSKCFNYREQVEWINLGHDVLYILTYFALRCCPPRACLVCFRRGLRSCCDGGRWERGCPPWVSVATAAARRRRPN